MRFGYHLPPPLSEAPAWLADHGVSTFQTYLRDKLRFNQDGVPSEEEQTEYRNAALGREPRLWAMAHAALIVNIASPDPKLRNGSVSCLVKDANLAASLGFAGVCFHVGYEKGHESRDAAHALAARKYGEAIGKLREGGSLWLENGAEGTELGQTVGELAFVLHAALDSGADPDRVGIVLDTCHLHVTGFDLQAPDAPDRLAVQLETGGLLPFLRAIHLNDAQFECGSRRDRHAVPGTGTINVGLRRLAAHPAFSGLPAILELDIEEAAAGIAWMEAEVAE